MPYRLAFALAFLSVAGAPAPARANPDCGVVEIRLRPGAPDLQMVVWIEDKNGKYIDTAYVTRLTGQFGLANRPGTPLLKTDFRWPYGRREMVAPVWAHHRDHHYPKVVMGGACGNSPDAQCPGGGGPCGGDCEDSTIAYHSRVSSYEPFYCSPSGASRIDAMSCASKGTFSKGAYRPFPAEFSLYPPRADLNAFSPNLDSLDIKDFINQNDLVAVSQATPPPGKDLDPAISWLPQNPLPVGDYVAWVELSQESDFNTAHTHPNQADTVQQWDFEGHPFLGQPSIVYNVPFHYDAGGFTAIASGYAGYSTWDASDGMLHPPDNTITTAKPGSGAGRLLDVNDGMDVYRVKLVVGACQIAMPDAGAPPVDADAGAPSDNDAGPTAPTDGGTGLPPPLHPCTVPVAADGLMLSATATSITVTFNTPTSGTMPNRFAVRYHESTVPLDETSLATAIAAQSVSAGAPGAAHTVTITGVIPKTSYAVAVRGLSSCNKASAIVSQVLVTPEQKFATLDGCFIATAAYGSPLEPALVPLRRFRDTRLVTNPAGRLFVAGYYAFSPSLAGVIARRDPLRIAARRALAPLVAAVAN